MDIHFIAQSVPILQPLPPVTTRADHPPSAAAARQLHTTTAGRSQLLPSGASTEAPRTVEALDTRVLKVALTASGCAHGFHSCLPLVIRIDPMVAAVRVVLQRTVRVSGGNCSPTKRS